jgi:tRNA modification GTPase
MTVGSTIFAVSTGQGIAAIAVVRLSGPGCEMALGQLGRKDLQPRHFSLVRVKCVDGELIDEAVAIWLPGPATVTGEDMVEFHVHGSAAVVERLLRELASFEGFRPAQAGEFTRRGFLNGRMNLMEIEGLADLLVAESEAQRKLAMRQFTGEAGSRIAAWRERLLSASALLEAAIDFVDESDVADAAVLRATPAIEDLKRELEQSVLAAQASSAVRRGLRIVIAGAPNAGKSSLLNALVGRRAAIVSAIAGTTRDVVEAPISLAGLNVTLADTAGLREMGSDVVEQEGIALSRQQLAEADILIWVDSLSETLALRPDRRPDLVVLNKIDLVSADSIQTRNESWEGRGISLSLVDGQGLAAFQSALSALIVEQTKGSEHAVLVRERHRLAAEESIRLLNDALNRPRDRLELMAEDVRNAARALSVVTGRVGVEDVLGKIFSEFCVGK